METVVKKLYEAMFLVDSEQATDWEGINTVIKNILKRSDAEIVSMRKWDERKLAYPIKKQGRGTYILCYFRADGGKIRDIERDVRLSERIMRVLVLNADAMSQEDIEKGMISQKDISAAQAERKEIKSARQGPLEDEVKQEDAEELAEFEDQPEQESDD